MVSALLTAVAAACASSTPATAPAQPSLRLQQVATMVAPVHVAAPRSEPNRVYVVEQDGRIRVVQNGRVRTFLDISGRVQSGGEQGLLSVAFHPQYARNRRFFVAYTDNSGNQRIVEFRSNGTRALLRTARQLFFIRDPYANHNGGQLAFGPDGYLYQGMGDGGSGGDPENRAQNLRERHGKLMRLNVNRRDAQWEIVGYGLRNPWRFSFDRATGDLYIGDVGQNAWEEVDFTPRNSPGLENYGWDVYEGNSIYEQKQPNPAGRLVPPIHVYRNGGGECSVTGGFVYRGRAIAALRGRYIFGDFCSGRIWTLRVVGGRATDVRREAIRVSSLSSFGEDARGELYATSLQGAVYRIRG